MHTTNPNAETVTAIASAIANCDFRECGQTFWRAGTTVSIEDTIWRGSETTFQVPVTKADQCDFRAPIVSDQSEFRATGSKFGAFQAYLSPATRVALSHCLFSGGVRVLAGAPEFTDCEFGSTLVMNNRTGARVENCILLDSMLFRSDAMESNAQTAWYAAGMIRGELSQVGIAVNEVASSGELPDLIASNDTNALSIFLEDKLQKLKTITPAWLSLQNWVIMTPEGGLVVRWPDAAKRRLNNC